MENSKTPVYQLLRQLEGALATEHLYQPMLQLPVNTQDKTDITCGMRDGSAHVLRCLKVWFDLPSEVLLLAIHSMDRFLTKMKALRKHLACISVSALHLAANSLAPGKSPDLSQLATISQCGCTPRDLTRMASLIEQKLGVTPPITPMHYLTLFLKLFDTKGFAIPHKNLLHQKMEILACDSSCSNFRPCELALVLICMHLQEPSVTFSKDLTQFIADMALHIQHVCKIGEGSFWCCHQVVLRTFEQYNGQNHMPYKQRLVWRLSHRTLRYLKPTSKLNLALPTIQENSMLLLNIDRKRSHSLSSEETSESERDDDPDWLIEVVSATKWDMLPLLESD